MRVLLSMLNDFAPFGTDPEPVAAALNRLGLAVDGLERVGEPIAGVITARVVRRAPHPNADRIGLVWVDVGDGAELQICCGAFNMSPGDVVPLATVGTVMPDGRDIQRSKMRGEWSNGMLCSARELGLGDDHGGILLLDPATVLGVPIFEALGVRSDVVFELDLTRNRPDCWGHLGIARDLAAHLRLPFSPPDVADVPVVGPSEGLSVSIIDPHSCGRFTARRITGIAIAPSPSWMAERLTAAGMRPINNVVDVSNYVMLELNRPSHAYDEAKLGGGGFIVRSARAGEQTETLDGVVRTLTDSDCVICDALDTPIGIAGIMGGASTEVDDATTAVALEQAWFEPVTIASSVARLGLRSEASTRFERGVDPFDDDYAARRIVQLLRLSSPQAALHDVVAATGQLPPYAPVTVRVARANAVLGTELDGASMASLVAPIGYETIEQSASAFTVRIPSWRFDSTLEIDVIEEIARHHGYDNIVRTVPNSPHPGGLSDRQQLRRRLRRVFIGLGINEAMPMPFLAPGDLAAAGLETAGIAIANPLVADESVLRTSLRPGLLRVIGANAARRAPVTAWFEIGHVFLTPPAGQLLPDEPELLSVALAGQSAADAVRVLSEVFGELGREVELAAGEFPGLHPTRAAAVLIDDRRVGLVGEVDPDVAARFGAVGAVGWLELDLDLIDAAGGSPHVYRAVSRYPSNDVDLAFVVPETVPASAIRAALVSAAGDLLGSILLFDVYRGTAISAGSRSLAFALSLQAADRTLTDTDVGEIRARCIDAVEAAGGTLRS